MPLMDVADSSVDRTDWMFPLGHALTGRRVIRLNYDKVTRGNLLEVLGDALAIHNLNAVEIDYLWNYYKGRQPILGRVKEVRPEICNRIVENRAYEIVSFKVGYLMGEPVQYVGRHSDENIIAAVNLLNDYMFAENKASKDQELVEWDMVCGTAYRMVLADPDGDEDESPFEIYTCDPRRTFVAYSTGLGNKPLIGVKYRDTSKGTEYSVFTSDATYIVLNNEIVSVEPHLYGMIPIIEYPANAARLGAFEIVLPLLDALNNIASNRMDGIEQQIQAFLKFVNCDIDAEGLAALREYGAIKVKSVQGQKADVEYVHTEINQDQTETFKKDIYQAVLTICGMPNRNGGSSTSDTGQAVVYRDGFFAAETAAKASENVFKLAEKEMLRVVLRICRQLTGLNLKLLDVDMKFTRRNYDNLQSKSQVLVSMLEQARIHPKLAFEHCGMFSDPESAYTMSEEYYQEQMEKWEPREEEEGGHDHQDADTEGVTPDGGDGEQDE